MTDWFSDNYSQPKAPQVESAPSGTDWFAQTMSTPTSAPQGKVGAEMVVDPQTPSIGFGQQMRANLPPDPEKRLDRYADILKVDRRTLGYVNGEPVMWNGEKYEKLVPDVRGGPGEMFSRVGNNVSAGLPDAVPGVVGGLATVATRSPLLGTALSGAVAGGTEMARQAFDNILAGESVGDVDYGEVAKQSGFTALGSLGGYGLARLFSRNQLGMNVVDRLKAQDPQFLDDANNIMRLAKTEYGIDLTVPQATELKSLLVKMRQGSRWDETADMVDEFRSRQWGEQVPRAIQNEVGKISGARGEAAVASFRKGADDIVDSALDARSKEARLAFGEAFDAPAYNTPKLDELVKRPSMSRAWRIAKENAADEGRTLPEYFKLDADGNIVGTVQKPDWQAWHDIKVGLDRIVKDGTSDAGRMNANAWRASRLKKELMSNLRGGGNDSYFSALAKYGESSDAVDVILNGGIGVLRNMKGADTITVINKIFNRKNFSPTDIRDMRQTFYSAGKSTEWNAGVARWMEGKMNDAMQINAGGEAGNIPGKFYKSVFGHPEDRAIVREAVGQEAYEGLQKFMEVLRKASRNLPEGSPTATDMGAMSAGSIGGVGKVIGKVTSPGAYLDLGDNIIAGITALREPAARVRLIESLLSDDGMKQLRNLRMLGPGSDRAVRLTGNLITRSGIAGLGQIGAGKTSPDLSPQGPSIIQ